jgi:hypothetical protein
MRPNRIGGRTVDHPDFDVLWGKAQQLDVPVSFHEAYLSGIDTVGLDRMSSYAGCHIVSHVFEQMTAMVNVTLSRSTTSWLPTTIVGETRAIASTHGHGSLSRSRSLAWRRPSSKGGPTT